MFFKQQTQELSHKFEDQSDAALTMILLFAAVFIACIAIFSKSKPLKIVAILYILLP